MCHPDLRFVVTVSVERPWAWIAQGVSWAAWLCGAATVAYALRGAMRGRAPMRARIGAGLPTLATGVALAGLAGLYRAVPIKHDRIGQVDCFVFPSGVDTIVPQLRFVVLRAMAAAVERAWLEHLYDGDPEPGVFAYGLASTVALSGFRTLLVSRWLYRDEDAGSLGVPP